MLTRAQQGDIYILALETIDRLFQSKSFESRYDQLTITRAILTDVATEFLAENPQTSAENVTMLLETLCAEFSTDAFYTGLFTCDSQDLMIHSSGGEINLRVKNVDHYLKSFFGETINERDSRLTRLKEGFLRSTSFEIVLQTSTDPERETVRAALDALFEQLFFKHYLLTTDEVLLLQSIISTFLQSGTWPESCVLVRENGKSNISIPHQDLF